mmetsp:Transcript_59157/g.168201  ORF Transcript_59157/g.168201 Transcript_59157/m.168201 type:complete len:257 (+) Transcript_59157:116-886(+)
MATSKSINLVRTTSACLQHMETHMTRAARACPRRSEAHIWLPMPLARLTSLSCLRNLAWCRSQTAWALQATSPSTSRPAWTSCSNGTATTPSSSLGSGRSASWFSRPHAQPSPRDTCSLTRRPCCCRRANKWDDAIVMLKHCMDCARVQVMRNGLFVFEHPWRATSWQQQCAMDVMGLQGVRLVVFDQCRGGGVTKITKFPVRKRTQLMTDSSDVVALVDKQFCTCTSWASRGERTGRSMRRSTHLRCARLWPNAF